MQNETDIVRFIKDKTQNWSKEKKIIVAAGSVVAILIVGNSVTSGGIGATSGLFKSKYVELSTSNIKQLDCDELIKKNVGKKREFCGYVGGGFITVYKGDLYNSWPKHCYNSMKLPDDTYCYIFFGQYDNSRFYHYPEGMFSFTAKLSSDCSYEYMNMNYNTATYCLKDPTSIRPADDKTKAKMGMY